MGKPFKNLTQPPAPALPRETQLVPQGIPPKRDVQVNTERADKAPDHEPSVPWPQPAGGVDDTNPIKK
jgi:hypothetical protein